MRGIVHLLLIGMIFCIARASSAQVEGKTYPIFDKENAWFSSADFVYDILLGSEGNLWFGTNSKLVRWDGQHKRNYETIGNDGFQIDGKKVAQLFEKDTSTLVLLTQKEKLQVEILNKEERKSRVIPFIKNERVNQDGYLADIFQSAEGQIYAILNQQNILEIYELIGDRFIWNRSIKFEASVDQKTIKGTLKQDDFWIGIETLGVWKCGKETSKKMMDFTEMTFYSTPAIKFLHADKNDRLWLSINAKQKLLQWNPKQEQFEPTKIPSQEIVNKIKEDASGNVIFICGKYPEPITKVYLYKDDIWQDYTSLHQASMLSIFPARDFTRSFYAFTSNNVQVVEIKKQGVQSYLEQVLPPGRYGTIIKGINEDQDGNIYFLSEINEFYKLNISTNEVSRIPVIDEHGNEISFRCGGAMHRDHLGNLWFKTCDAAVKGLLIKFDPKLKRFQIFTFDGLIRDIDIHADQEIWVTYHDFNDKKGRLAKFNFNTQEFAKVPLANADGTKTFAEPRFCLVANDTTIWLGTIKGLVKVNPVKKSFEIYSFDNNLLRYDYIITIHEDKNGQLILGTSGGGLYIFDPTNMEVKNYNKTNGLIGNYVCGILPIDSTHYWLSTFSGISYWDRENELFFNIDQAEGLSHHEFNRYAFYESTAGEYYFGNVNGVNRFQSNDLIGANEVPILGISKLTQYFGNADTFHIQELALDQIEEVIIYPEVTYLEFDFFVNDFARAKNSVVWTKLEGYDNEWVATEVDKKVRYRRLPYGTYRLLVKAYSAKGVKTVNELTIKIISKNYFYKTWWFSLMVMTLLLSLSWWWSYHRLEQMKTLELEKQQVNRRFAALELEALQAQLNPHFIFNALGAIQYYIQVSNVEAADIYLTRFAQLMRKYLDSSKEKMISVKDEIDLLRIYSELEQLRFDHSFKVDIKVEEDLYPEDTYLPSVMIQPFVENAIIIDEKIQTLKMSGLMDIKVSTTDLLEKEREFPGTKVVLQFANLIQGKG